MTIDDVIAIESIRKLKAKYLRLMDQRRWDEWIALFAEDATIRVTIAGEEYCLWRGKAEILEGNSGRNVDNESIHHGHTPDIDVDGDRATAHWQLMDTYLYPEFRTDSYGYYEDEYVRIDGVWKIRAVNCHLHLAAPLNVPRAMPD